MRSAIDVIFFVYISCTKSNYKETIAKAEELEIKIQSRIDEITEKALGESKEIHQDAGRKKANEANKYVKLTGKEKRKIFFKKSSDFCLIK